MINTIFYFPSSLQQYDADASNLNARTISFVPPTSVGGTGTIYKNGVRYGKMTTQDIKNEITNIMLNDPYVLPIASRSTLGGIMIGDGLTINSSGTVGIDLTGLNNVSGLKDLVEAIIKDATGSKASTTQYGVVKIGDGISVNNGVISVDFTNTPVSNSMKASKSQYGVVKVGKGIGVSDGVITIDTSDLTAADLAALKGPKGDPFTYSDFTQAQLNALKGEKGDAFTYGDFTQSQLNALKGADGTTPNISATASVTNTTGTPSVSVTRTGTNANPTFNFAFSGLKGQQGIPGNDATGTSYDDTEVRQLIQLTQNNITSLMNNLDGMIDEEVATLVSSSQWIQDNFAPGVIGSSSNFGQNDVQQYLQTLGLWITSDGVTTTTWSTIRQDVNSLKLSVQQLLASQGSGGTVDYSALAGALYTYIENNTATSGIQSTWARFYTLDSSEIQMLEWIAAGVSAQANSQQAVTNLFSAAHDYETNQQAYAGLSTRVSSIEGSYVSSTELASSVSTAVNTATAGLATLTYVDNGIANAVSSLFATNGAGTAAITAEVSGLLSTVTIDASRISNLGTTIVTTLGSSSVVIGNGTVSANKLIAGQIGCDGELFITCGGDSSDMILQCTNSAHNTVTSDLYLGKSTSVPDGYYFRNIYLKATTAVDINSTSLTNHGTFTSNGKITASGGIATNKIEDTSTGDAYISLQGNSGGSITLHAGAAIMANSTTLASSDESLKNIIADIEIPVESIADTRIVDYEFKSNAGSVRSGAIAQDWQSILPNTVMKDDEDHLALDYSSVALISAVTDAREIVKLKQENEELKQRLAAIEAKLGI